MGAKLGVCLMSLLLTSMTQIMNQALGPQLWLGATMIM